MVDEHDDELAFEDLIRSGILSLEDLDQPRRELISSRAAQDTARLADIVKSRISSDS